ncbi:hypothetical protein ABW19_dt0207679 [Dactylella cylindrospora]|nr:hypothetical protein ABW19_dt0207679 [Dactylella cylindrospora]
MSEEQELPLIVDSSRLHTVFSHGFVVHRYHLWDKENKYQKEYWQTVKKLGHGSYGAVYLQKCCKGQFGAHQLRAVKVVEMDQQRQIDWVRELETIMEFSHPVEFFVKSLGWFRDENSIFISMEYLEHGDLGDYLRDTPILTETEVREICFQLVSGLRYMHGRNFAHRDLKPNNIMIKSKPPDRWWVKIGDFGLSKRIEGVGDASTVKGTIGFMAPELLEAALSNKLGVNSLPDARPADMWSLGEIMARMLNGQPVFGSNRELWRYMERKRGLPVETLQSHGCSPDCVRFFTGLMARRPENRRTANRCYQHQWMMPLQTPQSPDDDPADAGLPDIESLDIRGRPFESGLWEFTEQSGASGSAEWTQTSIHEPNRSMKPQPLSNAAIVLLDSSATLVPASTLSKDQEDTAHGSAAPKLGENDGRHQPEAKNHTFNPRRHETKIARWAEGHVGAMSLASNVLLGIASGARATEGDTIAAGQQHAPRNQDLEPVAPTQEEETEDEEWHLGWRDKLKLAKVIIPVAVVGAVRGFL